MAFLVMYSDSMSDTIAQLSPGPTEVEYPSGREFTEHISKDNAVVLQRPLRDGRKRQWVWHGYHTDVPGFSDLLDLLTGLETRQRIVDGEDATIYVWEDDTEGENPFNELTDSNPADLAAYTNIVWTEVKVTNVYRKTRKGGGPTKFDELVLEFYVTDASWEGF